MFVIVVVCRMFCSCRSFCCCEFIGLTYLIVFHHVSFNRSFYQLDIKIIYRENPIEEEISDDDIINTIEIASQYDIVIVVVGDNSMRYRWNQKTAGENTARADLNLAGKQLDLVRRLKELEKNVIVVYVNGRPESISNHCAV